MKRTFLFCLGALSVLVLCYALQDSPAKAAAREFNSESLKWRFREGDKLEQKLKVQLKIDSAKIKTNDPILNGWFRLDKSEWKIDLGFETEMSDSVGNQAEDGAYPVQCDLKRLQYWINAESNFEFFKKYEASFDSKSGEYLEKMDKEIKKEEKVEEAACKEVFQAIPLLVSINPGGVVSSLKFKKVDNFYQLAGKCPPLYSFSPNDMNILLSPLAKLDLLVFPEKKITIGDRWKRDLRCRDIAKSFFAELDGRNEDKAKEYETAFEALPEAISLDYKLAGVKNDIANIQVKLNAEKEELLNELFSKNIPDLLKGLAKTEDLTLDIKCEKADISFDCQSDFDTGKGRLQKGGFTLNFDLSYDISFCYDKKNTHNLNIVFKGSLLVETELK